MYGVSWTHNCYCGPKPDDLKQIKRWWEGTKWLEKPIDVGPFSDYNQAITMVSEQSQLNSKFNIKNHAYLVYNEGDPLNQRLRVAIQLPDGRSCYAETNPDNPNKVVAIFHGDKITIEEAQVGLEEYQERTRKALEHMRKQMDSSSPAWIANPSFVTESPVIRTRPWVSINEVP